MNELRSLDLRGNQLQKLPEELLHLKQHAPQLQTLDLRHNPWLKVRFCLPARVLRYESESW